MYFIYIFAHNNIYSISNRKNKVNSLLNKIIIYYSLILWELNYMNIAEIFGRQIKSYRKALRLSQEELAERCGLHSTYIGQIERGEKNASLESIQKLSRGLNIPIAKLFECFTIDTNESTPAAKIYYTVLNMENDTQNHILNIINEISEIKKNW